MRLEYLLVDGYIHNWLVAGPQAISVSDLESYGYSVSEEQEFKLQVARHYYEEEAGLAGTPTERALCAVGDDEFTWNYYRCLDDHLVDVSGLYRTCHYLRTWAYGQLVWPESQDLTLVLTTNGPADVWINGRHVHRHEHFHHQDPLSVDFQCALEQGANEIVVRFEAVAVRDCPYVMALRVVPPEGEDLPDGVSVVVPTSLERVNRRQMLEQVFEQAHLEQFVSHKGNHIVLHWADDLAMRLNYECQVQDARNRTYVDALPEAQPSETLNMGHPARLWEGQYDIVLRPRPEEWYAHNTRYERRIPIHVLDNPYCDTLYGTLAERSAEALEYAAKRGRDVYAEIAKLALGRGEDVDRDRVIETIAGINRCGDCGDFCADGVSALVGLLGALYRYGAQASFPQELEQPLKECVLGFRYWHDEEEGGAERAREFFARDITESQSILFHTCEILAGQLYPDHAFGNAGQTGQWHRERGEKLALHWLHDRGTSGFAEWDSNSAFEQDLVALSHLVDLAENPDVCDLAAVVMDKLLLTIALNSFKGVLGSTHGRTQTNMIKSGQLEATSGATRLLWGMGVWNHHVMGVVSLACSEYEMPLVAPDIAVNLAEEMWDREQHVGVNKVTYRTPDSMLSSVQDYRPGEQGRQEHVWQATMGPDAQVFVTHPPNVSEADVHQPNFWRGNAVLPRVAQWKDVLVAVHKLPEDDWMGFTHAHFPVYAFDEHEMRDSAAGHPWAFARKGRAYLALTAAQGFELVRRGPGAHRELRSYGRDNVWLCLMGRPDTDGSFLDFQKKVLALDVEFDGLAVRCTTHRGETLSFGWQEPLLVSGEEQALCGFKHYENPYCVAELPASQIEIRTDSYLMKLTFDIEETDEHAPQEV
jgi:hypothetical protein